MYNAIFCMSGCQQMQDLPSMFRNGGFTVVFWDAQEGWPTRDLHDCTRTEEREIKLAENVRSTRLTNLTHHRAAVTSSGIQIVEKSQATKLIKSSCKAPRPGGRAGIHHQGLCTMFSIAIERSTFTRGSCLLCLKSDIRIHCKSGQKCLILFAAFS